MYQLVPLMSVSAIHIFRPSSSFLSGLIGKNSVDKEPSGPTLRDLWDNSTNVNSKPLGPIGAGLSVTRVNAGNPLSLYITRLPSYSYAPISQRA